MAGYVILDIDVHDPIGYEEYRAIGAPTLAAYGGRFLVRGGEASTLEGGWQPHRIVVLEFDTLEQAQGWYHSSEYAPAKDIRFRTAKAKAVVVEGLS